MASRTGGTQRPVTARTSGSGSPVGAGDGDGSGDGADAGDGAGTQELLDALASPVRRDILWLVWDRELSAGEIGGAFELSAPTISQHLAVLRQAGLIEQRRQGRFRYYRARREALARAGRLFEPDPVKWAPSAEPAPDVAAGTAAVVITAVDVEVPQDAAFRALTDGDVYSRWLGVPVTLVDGAFTATMEWGLRVRGRYDHVLAPSLIALTWDFDEQDVPVPGAAQRAYVELVATVTGCRVTVHQLVAEPAQVTRMERIWGLVLSRLRDHVAAALDPAVATTLRPPTARRRPGAVVGGTADPAGSART
ncbi:MAG: metalloregulator ArsR/SmtB family transcription factor [Acidimicrobiales bacterium]